MKTIFKSIKLNGKWKKVNQPKYNDFFMVGLKVGKKSDTICIDDVSKIVFEIGIESGVKTYPLITNLVTLDFNAVTTALEEINQITALTKIIGYPQRFFIRPSEIHTKDGKVLVDGKTGIKISIDSQRLHN